MFRLASLLFVFALMPAWVPASRADAFAAELPGGVRAFWGLNRAYREVTPACERICLNGLWRWQPAAESVLPEGRWGYFKVPGAWPGITDYMQKDSQTVFPHDTWNSVNLGSLAAAWYEREVEVPADWRGRTIFISTKYLNSFASVYVDGRKAGEIRFPGGDLDITRLCEPGQRHTLSLLVTAMPLKAVLLSYTDSASARAVKGSVARRGLCGDVYLDGIRATPRFSAVKVRTSFREPAISFHAALQNLNSTTRYSIRAEVKEQGQSVKVIKSPEFTAANLVEGMFQFSEAWKPEKLWDIHTPRNQYDVTLSLLEQETVADTTRPLRIGFRELWIDGRDFYLNGTRVFLSAVPLDNAEVGAAWATYEAARESLERLKTFGINFVYTHNYGCEPGSHLSFDDVLRAADDTGMLVALSQPHFSHYDWKGADADRTNGYAAHAKFYAEIAGNHPSVVFYSMSHNATGYSEDMNPDLIDGLHDPRDQWSANNAKLAMRAERIVSHLDPTRIIYHHASGNLGSMHPMNFYPNFVPVQELSDWFGHWATNGVKPAFMCEYGAPFTWDWTMYRGWFKGEREFGSARVPWEFCVAEWNAQFFGDRAYRISEPEKANLRWEAAQFRAGHVWHRWDYPFPVGSSQFEERYPVFALYLNDNWRAFRGWGVSGISPWEYEHFWKLRDGVKHGPELFNVDWENLQRPGYSPDYIKDRYERMDLAFAREDWIPTAAAAALIRNNGPLLAFIAGKSDGFTSKDHVFYPGETVEKQLILINNSREPVNCRMDWTFGDQAIVGGGGKKVIPTGQQIRIPMRISLPRDLAGGNYELRASVKFDGAEEQRDAFAIQVLPRRSNPLDRMRIALFDPQGESERMMWRRGIDFKRIDAHADLSPYDLLVVGKNALTMEGLAPDISRVRDGLKVVIFEQTAAVLEKRFGFRVTEYGLRQVFPRVPDHPILAGLTVDHLHDWRGEATILSARLTYEMRPRYGPTVKWCDLPVTRVWRCGNRGSVASVLLEKPARGDFLPILDGGYALQYSPLLEYREGHGLVLFCQLDLTGRTEDDPAAETLAGNIFEYLSTWRPGPRRNVFYAGGAEGKRFLESVGVHPKLDLQTLGRDDLLVVAPQGGAALEERKDQIAAFLKIGGNLLAIGLAENEANPFLPLKICTEARQHIAAWFPPEGGDSLLKGIAPADVHNRDPEVFPLVTGGLRPVGDGVLASSRSPNIVLFQMPPWRFEKPKQMNVKRTWRKAGFTASRLLGNLGAESSTPILARFHSETTPGEKRWLEGLYLDIPEEWDDPYRFFRW